MSRILSPVFASYNQGQDGTLTISLDPTEDVTGWTVTFTVRAYSSASTALITKTIGSGITVTNLGTGVFVVALNAADLAALTPGMYVWDMVRTNAGFIYPIADPGTLLITSSVYAQSAPTLTNVAELLALTQDGTPEDADSIQMMLLLGSVESAIKHECGRNFIYGTHTQYIPAKWTDKILLRETPIEAITTIHYDQSAAMGQQADDFGSDTLLTVGDDYFLDRDRTTDSYSNSGIVYRTRRLWTGYTLRPPGNLSRQLVQGPGIIKAVYTGGYGNNIKIPMDLKHGIWDGVQMLRQTVDLGRAKQSESGEGYTYSLGPYEQEMLRLNSVQRIISTYKRGELWFR